MGVIGFELYDNDVAGDVELPPIKPHKKIRTKL